MQIETDDWVTAGEASRLLDVSHTRVIKMIDDDGSLDAIRPWDHVVLVGRESLDHWIGGARQPRIQPAQVRKWVLAKSTAASIQAMDIDVVRDLARDFIEEARPRWDNTRKDLWALNMASFLFASGGSEVLT